MLTFILPALKRPVKAVADFCAINCDERKVERTPLNHCQTK